MKKIVNRQKRKLSIRKKLAGTADRPRITVSKTNRYFYAQAIDDQLGVTLCATRSEVNPTVDKIKTLGEQFGKAMLKLKLAAAVYDRNGYTYHGKVAAFADGLRTATINI